MKRRLDTLVDQGCWISNDRVYAFCSAERGVTEIGYHGRQPVSRNSRVLSGATGVLQFAFLLPDGARVPVRFGETDWSPGSIRATVTAGANEARLRLRPDGRRLCVQVAAELEAGARFVLSVAKTALFTDVHGERTWAEPAVDRTHLFLAARDRINLVPWLSRRGPYAGDFLIPEPVRRVIFSSLKRSGEAKLADLKPEFRTIDIPLYDAGIFIRAGGRGFQCEEREISWDFTLAAGDVPSVASTFAVEFADLEGGFPIPEVFAEETPDEDPGDPGQLLRLSLEHYPAWEEFIPTVPALVRSSLVRDLGMPRACPGRYYWIWTWDALVTANEALRWGDMEIARSTLTFINTHRDDDGRIPARWTRALLPMDTPGAGSLDFLLASLAHESALESQSLDLLSQVYPDLVRTFEGAEDGLRKEGFVPGEGFYPDLPGEFGRTEESAVCMETGSWYVFCRILEQTARSLADEHLSIRAGECAESVQARFDKHFWDRETGFWVDSFDPRSKKRSTRHPLFSLLFLHSPLGYALIRRQVKPAAAFIAGSLVSPHGIRSLPLQEAGAGGEPILDAWYPYWDSAALKILRRAGNVGDILKWLGRSEEVLAALGYCPEFLELKGFREGSADAWHRHGAASNLNCVTGWMRAVREGVFGLEFDPGGITHIPLALPLGRLSLKGFRWRGGTWTAELYYGGPFASSMIVDGEPLAGLMKIPIQYAGPGEHSLEIHYGTTQPDLTVIDLVNAEVHGIRRSAESLELEIVALGAVDGSFFSAARPSVEVDGANVRSDWSRETGEGQFFFNLPGARTLRLMH